MQTLFLSGNLAADCEIVPGKEGKEFIRFTVAAKDPAADKDDKPTYYTCRMPKTGVAERLKKGRYVALVGDPGCTPAVVRGVTGPPICH